MSYIGNEPIVSATRTVTEVSATAGQTVFTANGGYTVGFIDVFVNGSKLTNSDFTATNGTTITLNEAAQASDIVRLEALGTFLTSSGLTANNPEYTGTLTGGTGVVNIGSGQLYKDGSGNVGIGTSSPAQALDVVGNIKINGANNTRGLYWSMYGQTNNGYIDINGSSDGNVLRFGTNNTERMRIDSSGRMLVGTTSGLDPNARFQCNSSGAQFAFWNPDATSGRYMYFGAGSDSVTRLYNNSNNGVFLAWNATSWSSSSDERLKDIIEPITNASEKVSSLRAVIGKYKSDEEGTRRAFLIAQDVQAVLPEAVSIDNNELQTLGLSYTDVIPLLVAAIKELKAELDTVKAENTEMKTRIETLESK